MSAQYDAVADPGKGLIRASVSGFFTIEDVVAFERMLRASIDTLCCDVDRHLTLCDATGMRIQSQEVVAAFAALARNPSIRSRRLAFVLGQSLARTQTRRLVDPRREGVAYFETAVAAEAWLFEGEGGDGPAVSQANSMGMPGNFLFIPSAPM